jgi:hypothetical protein
MATRTGRGSFLAQCRNDLPVLDERDPPGIFQLSDGTNNCAQLLDNRLDEIGRNNANFVAASHDGSTVSATSASASDETDGKRHAELRGDPG